MDAEWREPRGRHHFKSRKIGRLAVIFPPNQSGYIIPVFHSRAFEDPVAGFSDDPIAVAGSELMDAHQQMLVVEMTPPRYRSAGPAAGGVVIENDFAADRVTAQEGQAH